MAVGLLDGSLATGLQGCWMAVAQLASSGQLVAGRRCYTCTIDTTTTITGTLRATTTIIDTIDTTTTTTDTTTTTTTTIFDTTDTIDTITDNCC